LTTHYLEEAQEQYNCIVMLKLGQVVALDLISALIKHIAGSQLLLQLSGDGLPTSLQHTWYCMPTAASSRCESTNTAMSSRSSASCAAPVW